jgi:hypothetical protein
MCKLFKIFYTFLCQLTDRIHIALNNTPLHFNIVKHPAGHQMYMQMKHHLHRTHAISQIPSALFSC